MGPGMNQRNDLTTFFYNEGIDQLDPFSRKDRLVEMHTKLVDALNGGSTGPSIKHRSKFDPIRKEVATPMKSSNLKKAAIKKIVKLSFDEFLNQMDNTRNQEQMVENLRKQYVEGSWETWNDAVRVFPSQIHKYGLFATKPFEKGNIVIEYVGELVRNQVADQREETYKSQGFGDCYMFRVDRDWIVDATFKGNCARYLNHSCEPNCSSHIVEVAGKKHIVMFANRNISVGEELTYDYNFDCEKEKIRCTCGAKTCQGRLN
eukprot:TRINITY_DN8695_c0_g1_i3.p1 TRINITY_DN8695_c0_g1~~TRINITY_DN8695_c0_g1_i3.p1  ORF type:complete len:261 (+),score=50.78 TRINITY_DN8695_c0_g1_i3:107-889(+)